MPFGGKTVVLGGDFRQILPVIPKGTRQDIVGATINSSYLWRYCKVLRLTKNLRLTAIQAPEERQQTDQFAKWIADIGDGVSSECTDEEDDLIIPNHILLQYVDNPIAAIVESTFPNYEIACTDSQFLLSRAILAPTLDVVDSINDYMNEMNKGDSKTYLSCDTVCKADNSGDTLGDLHTPEFLNGLRCSGIPNHSSTIKVGSPVMLLRNIDHSLGLCNGTRLIVTRLANHVLEAKIMSGTHKGTKVLIPRMLLTPSNTRLPFKFQRKQFPLMLS
ncbi:uncharacterized protein LOC116012864 [Ipomoea triloba]|uniref:uncharacterized protein LOC116012864 n=1 Tax=Ipomoea triloba TaxID=35885 RepID=UPI00125D5876|nr:uncharacterized protein LOC116012864 [Ipomoea triloba]